MTNSKLAEERFRNMIVGAFEMLIDLVAPRSKDRESIKTLRKKLLSPRFYQIVINKILYKKKKMVFN